MDETATPKLNVESEKIILKSALGLAATSAMHAVEWLEYSVRFGPISNPWKKGWAITNHERIRLRAILDAVIASTYGVSEEHLQYILKNDPGDAKGFWRIDKEKPIELRQTTLTLLAYHVLQKVGLTEFCQLNQGDGWDIPEKIWLSTRLDGTLDFDDSNGTEFEVASKLGPRFLDWQNEGTAEESWRECEKHARNILGKEGFEEFMRKLKEGPLASTGEVSVKSVLDKAAKNGEKSQHIPQARLFDFNESNVGEDK